MKLRSVIILLFLWAVSMSGVSGQIPVKPVKHYFDLTNLSGYHFMVSYSGHCKEVCRAGYFNQIPVTIRYKSFPGVAGTKFRSLFSGNRNFWTAPFSQLLYLFVILVLTVLIIRYRTKSLRHTNQILREKEKIAEEVRRQRDQLSLAHKNLTDSIRYAQKIQQALLPSDYYFQRLLPESFILFLPKDMVSGDFYWITGREGKIFFTVADCTGHGVPGAFMSMIGFEILDKIINDQKVDKPAEILNILNQGIAATFSRGEENILLKDGMDLAFCALDRENRLLEFAGAFNPLYLIRDNNLIEFKADRFSVGMGEEENQRFTNHKLSLISGDKIYMFSDGYADQFGGPQGKKFMYRRFRHLLLSIHHLPLDQQKTIIYDTFLAWKGDLEQVDDILIIGVEPLVVANNSVQ